MVLGSPCSQELAAGAGSSRRRRGSFKQPCAARRSKPSARRRGSPSRAWQVFYGASSRGGADCCSPHFSSGITLRSAACVVLPVQEKYRTKWSSRFARGLAYEHTRLRRLACVAANASQRCIQHRILAGKLSTTTGRQQHRSVDSTASTRGFVIHRRANPPRRATPWLQDSSASASWAKAWPAAS